MTNMTTLLKTAEPRAASYIANDVRRYLVGLSRVALAEILAEVGVPEKQRRMRMRQLWHWIYQRGRTEFSGMTDIAKDLQKKLDEAFVIARPEVVT